MFDQYGHNLFFQMSENVKSKIVFLCAMEFKNFKKKKKIVSTGF